MRLTIILAVYLMSSLAPVAVAQQGGTSIDKIKAEAAEKRRAKLIEDCRKNRGVDCDSPKAIKEMERQNTPLTPEERARNRDPKHRDFCVRNPGAPTCR